MKHTPGPWELVEITDRLHQCVNSGRAAVILQHDGSPEAQANIRLCTASPLLLEACHKLLDMITDNRTHGPEIYFAAEAIAAAETL